VSGRIAGKHGLLNPAFSKAASIVCPMVSALSAGGITLQPSKGRERRHVSTFYDHDVAK
jgi:hypothetical protein